MTPIRIGFVGLSTTGWAATVLVPPLLDDLLSSKYKLTALSTTNERSATASATKYSDLAGTNVKGYHGSPDALIADEEVDLVAVAVGSTNHYAIAEKVIQGGKDLFLEWPVGRSLKETEALAEAARAKGIRTIVGLQARSSPYINTIKSIIESGRIGRVLSSSMIGRFSFPGFWGPTVAQSKASVIADMSNGATLLQINAGGHNLDTILYCLGPVASVTATTAVQYPNPSVIDNECKLTGETIPSDAPNQVAFIATLESGVILSVHIHSIMNARHAENDGTPPLMWTIEGEEGSLRIVSDSPGGFSFQDVIHTIYLNGEEVKVENDGMSFPARAWLAFAKGEGYPTIDDALETRRVTDAIERSAREGRRIHLE